MRLSQRFRVCRAATRSRSSCWTSASREGNACTSRRRRTHSTLTDSPYRSPAKSNRWISSARAAIPNVGRGPWFIIPPSRSPRHSTRTAYTPSGGSSLRGSGGARLSVGTPIVRPRPTPRSTTQRRLWGRPTLGRGEVAMRHSRPDHGRGNRLPVLSHGVHHVHPEPVARPDPAHRFDIPRAAAAEAVIVAEHQGVHRVARPDRKSTR